MKSKLPFFNNLYREEKTSCLINITSLFYVLKTKGLPPPPPPPPSRNIDTGHVSYLVHAAIFLFNQQFHTLFVFKYKI